MKKIKSIFSMMIIAIMAVSFTSCDTDADQADALLGIWQGTIDNSNYYQNGYDTEIRFYGDFIYGGTGDEYDRDIRTGDVFYSSFSWNVKNGVISIYYDNTDDFRDVAISNYNFNGKYFEGYMYNHHFQLTKIVDWSNWTHSYAKSSTRTSGAKAKRLFKNDSISVNK